MLEEDVLGEAGLANGNCIGGRSRGSKGCEFEAVKGEGW